MNATATQKPEKPKRATPVPSDETSAIRALREIRKLDAVIASTKALAAEKVKEKTTERDAVLNALTPGARRIVDRQMAEDVEITEEAPEQPPSAA